MLARFDSLANGVRPAVLLFAHRSRYVVANRPALRSGSVVIFLTPERRQSFSSLWTIATHENRSGMMISSALITGLLA